MEDLALSFVEIKMDAEIGSYQEDFEFDDAPLTSPAEAELGS